jgi:flagellar hook-length control protein FliK
LTRIRANEFVAKTAQNVRALAPNGASVARFHLTPDALGKVFVEINVQSSVATLNIKADNKEVVKLIEKQIGNLIDKLQLSGINTESVNVSQQNFEDAANSREGNSGQKNQEREAREEFLESLKKLKQLNDSDKKRILHGGNNA